MAWAASVEVTGNDDKIASNTGPLIFLLCHEQH